MDRNTLIGFALIGALLIGMFVINSKSKLAYEGEQKRIADSTAAALAAKQPKKDLNQVRLDSLKADSLKHAGIVAGIVEDTAKPRLVTIENDVMKVSFNTLGAQPAVVELKKFKK